MSSLIFQAISWNCLDFTDVDNNNEKSFIIKGFGRTTKNKTISVNIYEYTPHFYIKFNSKIEKFTCEYIKDFIKSECGEIDNVSNIKKKDFYGFANGELCNFIRLKFKTNQGYRSAIKILQKKVIIPQVNDIPIKYKLYESNLEPYLRMFHIKKILPSGWIKIPNGKYFDDYNLETHCNINIGCIWSDISGIEKDEIAPFKIASFDIECSSFDGSFPQASKKYTKLAYELLDKCKYLEKEDIFKEIVESFDDKKSLLSKSNNKRPLDIKKLKKGYIDIYNSIVDPDLNYCLSDKLDKVLPPLNGDAIIQIGTTVHLYGEQECSYKNIITLGTCDDIEGADVIQCENEIELLMQWRDLIIKIDPDIITGYNIFGFDFSYIVERAKELKIYDSFSKLGRIKDKKSEYVEKTLSSSALGDNLLKYIDIDGRVIIDMMKLIQRDHKLDYYKLDFVANHFIGLNKNDVTPQDIFRLQKGSSADRKVVGEYCLVDCELCNKLIMKLETIANNIGMANVCIVPLSYIFMRGQGIKIFSLVSKECRDEGFIIPTLNSYDENKLNDDEGYEGAIVLEPKVGIYINDPIAVLDYASLYPSSMISENISHDTIILDEKYNNIESYDYVDIKYDLYEKIDDKKVKKGEKTVRFVQTKEKGVIPKILMKLLQKRKETRKKMTYKTINDKFSGLIFENDDIVKIKNIHGEIITEMKKTDIISTKDTYDNFQKAVLDGLQLAYKVTANSIYGQCGARTSSIYLKDLAACTTAIGRSMIVKAKEFAETNYNAEIIYGDSVTADTPLIINIDNTMYLIDIDELDQIINNNWEKVFHYESNDYKEQLIVNQNMMIWTDYGWSPIKRLIKHFTYKKIYRISTSKGLIDVTEDHSLVSKDKEYIKPNECIINETELLHSFPSNKDIKPIFMEEYRENIDPFKEREYKSKSAVQLIYTIGKKKGYNNMKIIEEDGIFNIIKSNDINDKLLNMKELDNKEGQYVYDIETEIGRFHAGIGELIVKNTDSIFLKFKNNIKGKDAIIPTINKAKELVKNFRPLLKNPHDLEYEKIYYPFIIFSKKRYCANKYENDDVNYKLSYMGIALKRRDNANIVKKIYGGVLDIILNEQDIKKSINFLKKSLADLINDKYDLEDLIITKSIKANYKDPTKIAHKVLSMRMAERDAGNSVQVNDRIRYIYVQTKEQSKKLLQGDMIEDIDYVKEKKLKPNYEFYITNQIMKPIAQLYSLVLEDLEEYKKSKDHFKKMEKTVLETKKGDIEKTKDRINTLREKEIEEILFKKFIQEASIKGSQAKLITSYFTKKSINK